MAMSPGGNWPRRRSGGGFGRHEQRVELLLQRAPDPRQLGHGPRARHRRRSAAPHGPPSPRCGRPAPGARRRRRARRGRPARRRARRSCVRRVGHAGVRSLGYAPGHARDPLVIVPTFNEAENIEAIVAAIRSVLLRDRPGGFHIVVVDDYSPDGTGRLADRLAAGHEEVEVIHRKRREGLGPAYLAGFDRALAGGAAYVIEMDADLARPQGPAAAAGHGARRRRGPGAGLPLRAGAAWRRRPPAPDRRPRRLLVRPTRARRRDPGPDRRLPGFRREVLRGIDLPTVRTKGYDFQSS